MDPLLKVKVDQSQIDFLENALGKERTKTAIFNAIKRTTAAGARQVREAIAADLTVEKKYIDRAITSRVLTKGGEQPVGIITVSGRGIPMVGYRPTEGSDGVTVVMTRSRGPLVLRHAFMARVKTSGGDHLGVFTRKARIEGSRIPNRKATKEGFFAGLPIRELKGENLMTAVGVDKLTAVGQKIMAGLTTTLRANLQSQLDRHLKQKKGEGIQLEG